MAGTGRWRKYLGVSLAMLLAVALPLSVVLHLLTQEPVFFRKVEILSAEQRSAESRRFMQQSTAIINQLENEPAWRGVFRDTEVNAWLCDDFTRKHARVLPEGVSEPRVSFCDGKVAVAFRMQTGPTTMIVSVCGTLWLPEPNFVAVELDSAQIGRLPIPRSYVVQSVTAAARSAGLQIDWKRHESRPVALLQLDPKTRITVDQVDVKDGMIYLAGRCGRAEPGRVPPEPNASEVSWNDQDPDSPRRN